MDGSRDQRSDGPWLISFTLSAAERREALDTAANASGLLRHLLEKDIWVVCYAVFQPNYRGSGGYSPEFRKAGYGEWGRKMLSDIADGVSELGRRQIIDSKRVCIMGASYGGYAALAGVTMQHGLYRCAVSVAGISSMSTFIDYDAERNGIDGPAMRYWRKVTGSESGGARCGCTTSPRASTPRERTHRSC